MKKTLSINLNGVAFYIDEDAYSTLKSYLNDLSKHFSDAEESEILKDIDARIAELFTERLNNGNKTVVEMQDVEAVIETLGSPNQFDVDGDEKEPQSKADEKKEKRKYRKLYRNPNDVILGGVASGCAAYFGWDTTLMRILFVLIVIVGFGWFIPIYFLMWIIVPEAQTAAQQLEMQGVEPNLENIKEYIESDRFKESVKHVGNRTGEVFLWLFKALFILIGSIIGFAFILVAICVIAAILVILAGYSELFAEFIPYYTINNTTAIILFGSIAVLFISPAIGLIVGSIRLLQKRPNNTRRNHWLGWTLFIVWIIALLTVIGIGISLNDELPLSIRRHIHHSFSGMMVEETRNVPQFNSLQLSGNITAYLTQSDSTEVSLRCPEEITDKVKTEVENGQLKIYIDGKDWISDDIYAYIHVSDIDEVVLTGASELECLTTFTTDNLSLKLLGASDADCNINVKKQLHIESAGGSSIDLKGYARHAEINLIGASDLDAEKCKFTTCRLNATGASDAEIVVSDSLWVTAVGTSDIKYKGNPIFVSQKSGGLSSITKK